MSIASVTVIADRASAAPTYSKLALFLVGGGVDCIFADTVEGRKRISMGINFLGCVDSTTQRSKVLRLARGGQ